MEQTARDILAKRLESLNTKENNKAGLETQLALIAQAAELAMHDYAEAYNKQKIDKLQKFKEYVHDRLDKMGVPSDPEPENNAQHGCRIEGRLNFLQKKTLGWIESSPAQEVEKPDFEKMLQKSAFKCHPLDTEPSAIMISNAEYLLDELWSTYVSPLLKENQSLKDRVKELEQSLEQTFTSDQDAFESLYTRIASFENHFESLEAENEELRKVITGLIQMAEDGQALRRKNNTLVECLTEGDEQIRRARSLLATSPI